MGKRGWPKGRPRKQPEGQQEPIPLEIQPPEKEERGAFTPAVGTKREGGKAALMAENQEIAMRQEAEGEKSEREKIDDKYMEQFGTPKEEHSPEEEAPPPSEEEHPQEESEETPPQEEPEEEHGQEEMVSMSRYKAAEDKMHEATTKAAHYEKLVEEMAPHMKWDEFKSDRGTPRSKETKEQPKLEYPDQELFVSDYPRWQKQQREAQKAEIKAELMADFEQVMPQIVNQSSEQTEVARLKREFANEFKDVFEDINEGYDVMDAYIVRAKRIHPNEPIAKLYEIALPNFRKRMGLRPQKPQKKVIPLESPGKQGEREQAKPEKPMEFGDWEKESRDWVKFRNKKVKELQGI